VSYALESPPTNVAVADFNKDSVPDLVTASPEHGVLSVFLGKGDGSFRPARVTTVTNIGPFVAGDFNNDGKADVVWGQSVLLGNGDGTFQPAQMLSLPKNQLPNFFAAGDFNNDGKLDLAVGAYTETQIVTNPRHGTFGGSITPYVTILLGQGDGSFRAKSTIQGVGTIIVVGDFNRDRNLDALAPGMNLLLGNGDGSLQKPVATAGANGAGAVPLAVGDFNGDGELDVVSLNSQSDTVCMFLGSGSGTFQAPQTVAAVTAANAAVVVGDFNRDGTPDVVITDGGSGTASVLFGNGDGTFQAPQNVSAGAHPTCVGAVGDFNSDGWFDLVAVGSDSSNNPQLSVLLNDGHW
jgi:hypothetical protein